MRLLLSVRARTFNVLLPLPHVRCMHREARNAAYPKVFLDDLQLPRSIAASSLVSPFVCFECGVTSHDGGAKMKRCSACRKVFFCGQECNRRAWHRWHKALCEKGKAGNAVTLPSSSDAVKSTIHALMNA